MLGSVTDAPDIAHVLYRPTATPAESYPEAYDKCLKEMSDEERRFVESMHHRGDPIVVTCRKQGDGSWKIVAKRNFFLLDSLDVVEVHNGRD